MDLIPLSEIKQFHAEIEATVDNVPEIDTWCSSPDWAMATFVGFGESVEPLMLRHRYPGERASFALLGINRSEAGTVITGIEPMWGFGCPVVSPTPQRFATHLAQHLPSLVDYDVLALAGIPIPQSVSSRGPDLPLLHQLALGFASHGPAYQAEGITRQVIDLRSGEDAWWATRGSKFRRNVRRVAARASQQDIRIVELVDSDTVAPDAAFSRLLEIEHRSWKGIEGSGMLAPEMERMYRQLFRRLHATGRLRAYVAVRGDTDIGYIFGGVRNRRYRGLQLSYVADAGSTSVGHVLQLHQLRELFSSGEADAYDMGMDMEYKRRWADHSQTTVTFVVHRSSS